MAGTQVPKPLKISQEPWLTGLDEDWPSQLSSPCNLPHSPTVSENGHKHSARKCISCELRSRIPKPEAPSPRVRGMVTPRGAKQAQVKRGGSTTPTSARSSPTPRTSTSPRTFRSLANSPSKQQSPTRNKQPTPAKKKAASTPLKKVMSNRSSSTASADTNDQGTIQVRVVEDNTKGTPEWKRRVVRGEISVDEQCDLFAPMGLENIFKQPAIPANSKNRISLATADDDKNPIKLQATEVASGKGLRRQVSSKNNPSKHDNNLDQESVHLRVRIASSGRRGRYGLDGVADADSRLRSASGEEELRNEDLTPIILSTNNTVENRTGSGILQSALKQLGGMSQGKDLQQSGCSDGTQYHGESPNAQTNELLGVSSPFLPEDLSTGTEDALRTHPFVTMERGDYFESASFQIRQLSTTSYLSDLQSSILTNTKIRSSPPITHHGTIPQSPDDMNANSGKPCAAEGEVAPSERPQTGNTSSPLKLFANHDTFTNNKLMRRMSQFEETFQDISEDDEPASPSLVARRTRNAKRSLPNLRRGISQPQNNISRPVTQDAMNPRMRNFGSGHFDFEFSEQGGSIVSDFSRHLLYNRERQLRRRSSSRNTTLQRAVNVEYRLRNASSTNVLEQKLLRYSESRQSSLGLNPNVRRISNMSSRTTAPKRRRTLQQSEDQALDATELIESILNMSLDNSATRPRSQITQTNALRNMDAPAITFSGPDTFSEGASTQDDHKRSLTTQDFLDEATKVMSIIRAKSKYASGLTSVEESGISVDEEDEDSMSSRENLSRPPSREGVDMRKSREPRPMHPRVVSHLKKFADKEDTEQLMASVMSDLYHGKQRGSNSMQDRHGASNLPHIQILTQRKRKYSDDDAPVQSIPTVSSNGSNSKGVIASDMVSHLIPEQVNGMNYDRVTKTWVKQKVNHVNDAVRGEDSEDDPFGSIPDLSYDELEELKRVQQLAGEQNGGQTPDGEQTVRAKVGAKLVAEGVERPFTRDGHPFIADSSSVQSKTTTRFTSSGPQPETRATSWGTEDLTVNIGKVPSPTSEKPVRERPADVKTHHQRRSKQSNAYGSRKTGTISFSSPLVSHISYADDTNSGQILEKDTSQRHDEAQARQPSSLISSQRNSVNEKPLYGRPVSRIDEQTEEDTYAEMSLVRRNSAGQIDLTPVSPGLDKPVALPNSARHEGYSFHMSSLADFTVHQTDNPAQADPSYIAARSHPTALRQMHGAFALATEELIKHITDVEPSEPFWEQLRRLSLRDKGIVTLHQLDKFCPRLEDLDVSENELSQVDGIPSTLRDLRVQHNCLTNLTSWGHLLNLQYLDISGNQLETLDGFSGLVHLRELRANNNRIRHFRGVFGLNGLLRLELKNNNIHKINFEGSDLIRLNQLDLSNNQIDNVQHLEYLPCLESLDLSENQIRELDTSVQIRSLRNLKISSNRLSHFEASFLPRIRLLYLDNNYLTTVSGLEACPGIEIFSIREQFSGQSPELGACLDIDISQLHDTRKIFLSSNRLSSRTLTPAVPMLALQLLDIASCGVRMLPDHFGRTFPNLRVLNLNFNSISDLRSLANMKGLNRLSVAGNRISRLRMLCQTMAGIGRSSRHDYSSLKTIDLRNNPLTVGFYPPPVSGSGRADTHLKMLEDKLQKTRQRQTRIEQGTDLLPVTFGRTIDNAIVGFQSSTNSYERTTNVEIDDPYTLPLADADADQKFRSRLDKSTKSRRMTLELMIYAGTGGSVRVLDGLELKPVLEHDKDEVDRLWNKLEHLGVLTRKEFLKSA